MLFLFLQNGFSFRSVLAKIQVEKQVKRHYFWFFTPSNLSSFKKNICVLHHLAFLVWLPARIFQPPITHFLPLKSHFLTTILPFWAMCFMVLKGLFILFVVYIYAYQLAFCGKTHCGQHHFTLRLAAKRAPFSSKTHCIQRHIALHFVPKRTPFSTKQPRNRCKWQSFQINIHFAYVYNQPLFTSKRTSARIDFLRQGGRLVTRKGTHNVKIHAEMWTKGVLAS